MATDTTNPAPAKPHRLSIRLPHWGWFLLGTVALVFAGVGLSVWVPFQHEQQVVQEIESWGGFAYSESPEWLEQLLGEDRAKEFRVFQCIYSVQLDGIAVTDAEIAQLGGLRNLEIIGANDSLVVDIGLAHLSRLPNLNSLDLDGTSVTDAGLAHLSRCTKLRRLTLGATAVTNVGLSHLNGSQSMEDLSLKGTGVTDAGLDYLGGMSNLRILLLTDTAVTDRGIDAIQRALPDCKILH
jgi:hypothetical protein